jgi:hypothetical protein
MTMKFGWELTRPGMAVGSAKTVTPLSSMAMHGINSFIPIRIRLILFKLVFMDLTLYSLIF